MKNFTTNADFKNGLLTLEVVVESQRFGMVIPKGTSLEESEERIVELVGRASNHAILFDEEIMLELDSEIFGELNLRDDDDDWANAELDEDDDLILVNPKFLEETWDLQMYCGPEIGFVHFPFPYEIQAGCPVMDYYVAVNSGSLMTAGISESSKSDLAFLKAWRDAGLSVRKFESPQELFAFILEYKPTEFWDIGLKTSLNPFRDMDVYYPIDGAFLENTDVFQMSESGMIGNMLHDEMSGQEAIRTVRIFVSKMFDRFPLHLKERFEHSLDPIGKSGCADIAEAVEENWIEISEYDSTTDVGFGYSLGLSDLKSA